MLERIRICTSILIIGVRRQRKSFGIVESGSICRSSDKLSKTDVFAASRTGVNGSVLALRGRGRSGSDMKAFWTEGILIVL